MSTCINYFILHYTFHHIKKHCHCHCHFIVIVINYQKYIKGNVIIGESSVHCTSKPQHGICITQRAPIVLLDISHLHFTLLVPHYGMALVQQIFLFSHTPNSFYNIFRYYSSLRDHITCTAVSFYTHKYNHEVVHHDTLIYFLSLK